MITYIKMAGAIAAAATLTLASTSNSTPRPEFEILSPLASPTPTSRGSTPVHPAPREVARTIEPEWEVGLASYYSREGCIGCSNNLNMANGQPLDDNKITVAYNKAKLGTWVQIVNQKTLARVVAIVTDRGGYERHGKIIDITPATRDALGCSDTCQVRVQILGGAQ